MRGRRHFSCRSESCCVEPATCERIRSLDRTGRRIPTNRRSREEVGGFVPTPDIIVIGGSTGGPCALFVVIHTSPNTPTVLPEILTRAGQLPARHAVDGGAIERSRIYVARLTRLRPGCARAQLRTWHE
jgi:chemotaxis response regulator CheB